MSTPPTFSKAFHSFEHAYHKFVETIAIHAKEPTEQHKMSLVTAFGFTFQRAREAIKSYLHKHNHHVKSYEEALTKATQEGLLTDKEAWREALRLRNDASHDYDKKILEEDVHFILGTFCPLVKGLYTHLHKQLP